MDNKTENVETTTFEHNNPMTIPGLALVTGMAGIVFGVGYGIYVLGKTACTKIKNYAKFLKKKD